MCIRDRSQGVGRFELAQGHRLQTRAQNLHGDRALIEDQRDCGSHETRNVHAQRRQREVSEEDVHERRRVTKELDEGRRRPAREARRRGARRGAEYAECQ